MAQALVNLASGAARKGSFVLEPHPSLPVLLLSAFAHGQSVLPAGIRCLKGRVML